MEIMIEALESRIAPANLLSAYAFSYRDVDGDTVKVTFSKPILTTGNFDTLVTISGGLAGTGAQDLSALNLQNLGSADNGLNITITATPSATFGGDGHVSAVTIDAFDFDDNTNTVTGIDLGVVKVDGDLTRIDAGDPNSTTFAMKSLTAASMGLVEPGRFSDIFGPVGTVNITGDFAGSISSSSDNLIAPDFKSITIKGSILGSLGADAGHIYSFAGFTKFTVGGDIVGGSSSESGLIRSDGPIDFITVNGSIIGGSGSNSGALLALEYGKISVRGSLMGGAGTNSGSIDTFYGDISSLVIGGSIFGGHGDGSGSVRAGDSFVDLNPNEGDDATIHSMLVKGSVIGGLPDSGKASMAATIRADIAIEKLTINGSVLNANIAAGVSPGADLEYGTSDDAQTMQFLDSTRTIASLVVKNGVYATADVFTITAVNFGTVSAGGTVFKPGTALADFDAGFLIGGGNGILVKRFT